MTYSQMASQWFSSIQITPQTRCILFCFPYAGGGTGIFRHWPHSLAPEIVVCPLQLPGREARSRESPYTHVEPLVAAMAEAITATSGIPFAFFGHSMGAFLGFEVARYLRLYYQLEPAHLFVAAQRAPHLSPHVPYPPATLSDGELVDVLRQLGGTPEAILSNALLMRLVLPAIRADLALCADYSYKEIDLSLECPISVYGGMGDTQATLSDLAAWKRYTTGPFHLQMWEGGHFFLHQEQERLIATIRQEVESSLAY